jgi:hypothetical protein
MRTIHGPFKRVIVFVDTPLALFEREVWLARLACSSPISYGGLYKLFISFSRNWLRSAVSLVVIMGLTWIFGVLIVEVEALIPLAYIYTILVAFQGVFIFIIFVLLSKQSREAYTKWWKVVINESELLSKVFRDTSTSTLRNTSSVKKSTSNHANGGRAAACTRVCAAAPQVEPTPDKANESYDFPTIIITEPQNDSSPVSLKGISRGKRHWNNLRTNVQQGLVFKVVYSDTYFELDDSVQENGYTILNKNALESDKQ